MFLYVYRYRRCLEILKYPFQMQDEKSTWLANRVRILLAAAICSVPDRDILVRRYATIILDRSTFLWEKGRIWIRILTCDKRIRKAQKHTIRMRIRNTGSLFTFPEHTFVTLMLGNMFWNMEAVSWNSWPSVGKLFITEEKRKMYVVLCATRRCGDDWKLYIVCMWFNSIPYGTGRLCTVR